MWGTGSASPVCICSRSRATAAWSWTSSDAAGSSGVRVWSWESPSRFALSSGPVLPVLSVSGSATLISGFGGRSWRNGIHCSNTDTSGEQRVELALNIGQHLDVAHRMAGQQAHDQPIGGDQALSDAEAGFASEVVMTVGGMEVARSASSRSVVLPVMCICDPSAHRCSPWTSMVMISSCPAVRPCTDRNPFRSVPSSRACHPRGFSL